MLTRHMIEEVRKRQANYARPEWGVETDQFSRDTKFNAHLAKAPPTYKKNGRMMLPNIYRGVPFVPSEQVRVSVSTKMEGTLSRLFSLEQIECICESLYQARDGQKLRQLFKEESEILNYYASPSVIRAYLYMLYSSGKFEEVCKTLESCKFDECYFDELQALWYEAKYAEDERKKKKPLGPVEKYRLRKKFKPPSSIWDGENKVYSFTERARSVLKKVYLQDRYPSADKKREIAARTGLKITQISNWFKNKRQREKSGSDSSMSSPRYHFINQYEKLSNWSD